MKRKYSKKDREEIIQQIEKAKKLMPKNIEEVDQLMNEYMQLAEKYDDMLLADDEIFEKHMSDFLINDLSELENQYLIICASPISNWPVFTYYENYSLMSKTIQVLDKTLDSLLEPFEGDHPGEVQYYRDLMRQYRGQLIESTLDHEFKYEDYISSTDTLTGIE